jgi:DtxR family transcriptional regulator, Mn-dependent transcriptional regulator
MTSKGEIVMREQTNITGLSESVEMYLVMVALEHNGSQPVHLSLLADKLSISPVSANEMCHKLAERGLVDYQPYKGVTLTAQGETLAQRVLTRRRTWEIFLEKHLGLELDEASEIACQLEHITSDKLIQALSAYLKTPLPPGEQETIAPPQPLTMLTAGQRGQVVATTANDSTLGSFLVAQGVLVGTPVTVLAVGADGSILIDLAGNHLSLAQSVAAHITVAVTA